MVFVARTMSLSQSRAKLDHLIYMSLIDGYGALTIDIIFGQGWNLSNTNKHQKSHYLHEILP